MAAKSPFLGQLNHPFPLGQRNKSPSLWQRNYPPGVSIIACLGECKSITLRYTSEIPLRLVAESPLWRGITLWRWNHHSGGSEISRQRNLPTRNHKSPSKARMHKRFTEGVDGYQRDRITATIGVCHCLKIVRKNGFILLPTGDSAAVETPLQGIYLRRLQEGN